MNNLSLDSMPFEERFSSETANVEEKRSLFLRYLHIIVRRKWVLVSSVVIAAIVGLLVTLLMTPKYTAETKLEIKRESDRIVNVQGVEPEEASVDLEFYETQWGLLRSRTLAERVATELKLHDNADFFEMFGKNDIADTIREAEGRANSAGREERIREAGTVLLKNVSVAPTRLSRLVDVRFTSPDPALTTEITNTWSKAFIELSLERRFEATAYARTFLEGRLEQLRQRMQESERALVGYAASQRIINIPSATSSGSEQTAGSERPIVADDLTMLNRALSEAVADRVAAESRLRSSGGNTTEALSNQAIADLRTRRASLAAEQANLLEQFEPNYPPARALASQIQELDRAISREENRVSSTLRASFDAAAARERILRGRVQGLEGDLLDLRRRTIQYNIFQREVDTNRQLYDALLQRYKEIGVAGGIGVNNISIVDRAQVPDKPSSPNLILNLLISLVAGSLVGAGLALALEQLDQTISDPRDLEAAIGLPLLGTIPQSRHENPADELEDPKTHLVEAYLSAQTRLGFTTDHGMPRSLAVSSTRPGEGKSTTAYAIARQLARVSDRVVLVDGDMRSPSLHTMFGIGGERGLSNYLAGDDQLAAMIHHRPGGPSLLPAGPLPPNAAELLTGVRLPRLIADLLKDFDHVIIDAPPVMGLADTPLIAAAVEGVIFVVESHATPTTMVRVAVSRLRESKARVLGVLMTKFEAEKAQYGYGYEYGYGYGQNPES